MSSLTLKGGKPSEQSTLTSTSSTAPLASSISNASSVMNDANLAPVKVNSRTDFSDLAEHHPPASPTTSADGWGEVENGLPGDHDSDKDGWDDIEPMEEAKPPPALENIQAAHKRPVSQPKPQASHPRTRKTSRDDDDDLWGAIGDPAPKSTTSKALNTKSRRAVDEDDDPWGAIAAPIPKSSSSRPSNVKPSADDDLWASIEAPTPTTGHKPLLAGRGIRGIKTAAPKLDAQRINRTSSGPGV